MAKTLSYNGYDYAMLAPGDPEIANFVGYREGMEELPDGTFTAGTYVVGSNNGWQLLGTRGPISIYARVTPKDR